MQNKGQELVLDVQANLTKISKVFIALFFGFITQKGLAMNTLKVSISPTIPLDPVKIKSMADYDTALCLHRTWFEYDQKRTAIPGLISKWSFDQKNGEYHFWIDQKARWSDGSELKAEHLISNLKRLKSLKNSYGIAIDSLVDIEKSKILSNTDFILPTKSKKPSEAFFQRMGSVFLSVIHPTSWNSEGVVTNNKITIGPYLISKFNEDEIFLEKNAHDFLAYSKRIPSIHIKRTGSVINLDEFLNGQGFADIIQTYTLMSASQYQKILNKKFNFWTRAFDRVSYMAPIKPYRDENLELRNFLLILGGYLRNKESADLIPSQVKIASSLQPMGYPLYEPIGYTNIRSDLKLPKEVKIVGISGYQFDLQKNILEEIVKRYGIPTKLNFTSKSSIPEFLSDIGSNSKYDLKILSFGVADPEAATWLSLVLNKDGPFIELSKNDFDEFEKILRSYSGKSDEIQKLKMMLWGIGNRGSYLPLFHFSTMSIARGQINFKNIKELDETVDYSKLKME